MYVSVLINIIHSKCIKNFKNNVSRNKPFYTHFRYFIKNRYYLKFIFIHVKESFIYHLINLHFTVHKLTGSLPNPFIIFIHIYTSLINISFT